MKKPQTTYEKFMESLTPEQTSEFEQEYESLVIQEMVLAAMRQDEVTVRELAKLAGVSPTIVQGVRTGTRKNTTFESIYKILKGLGYELLAVKDGSQVRLNLGESNLKRG